MAFNPAAFKKNVSKESRMTQAVKFRDQGNILFKQGLLVNAEEKYSEAVEVLDFVGPQGANRSRSGDDDENQLLARCLSNRAICVLNMAEGKGVLDDGTPFISQFQDKAFLNQFRKQALEQAEEAAKRACEIVFDEKSLFRLGMARFYIAKMDGREEPSPPQTRVELMKDAGRCFAGSMRYLHTASAESRLKEVQSWLQKYGVWSVYPDYV